MDLTEEQVKQLKRLEDLAAKVTLDMILYNRSYIEEDEDGNYNHVPYELVVEKKDVR